MKLPRLREYRLGLEWWQTDLAKQAGIHRMTVRNIENGGDTRIVTVHKLARAIGISPEALMRE